MNEKQILRKQVILIATMDEKELHEYECKLSLSQLSDKGKKYLYKAVDIALAEYTVPQHDLLVESSELKEFA